MQAAELGRGLLVGVLVLVATADVVGEAVVLVLLGGHLPVLGLVLGDPLVRAGLLGGALVVCHLP